MKTTKHDKFKELIKQAADDRALSADFTASVMQTIEADTARELALKNLLQRHPAEGPAMDFTANVMAQLHVKKAMPLFKPIISKKAWYGIAAFIAVIMGLMVMFKPSGEAAVGSSSGVMSVIPQLVNSIPAAYVMAVAMIGVLLFADHLLTQHRRKTTHAGV